MSYAWTTTNALASLAAANFTWLLGPNDDSRIYIRDRRMGKQFVCTSGSTANGLTIDMGVATSLSGFALLNHNLATFGGTINVSVSAADNAGMTVNLVSAKSNTPLDFTRPHDKDHVLQFPAVSRRYWLINIGYGTAGSKTLRIGEVFGFASTTALTRMDVYGASGESADMRFAAVGSDNMEERAYLLAGPQRTKRLSFTDITESERQELEAIFHAAQGRVNPVLFVLNKNETTGAAAAADQDVMFAKLDLDSFGYQFTDFSRYAPPALVLRNLAREVGA